MIDVPLVTSPRRAPMRLLTALRRRMRTSELWLIALAVLVGAVAGLLEQVGGVEQGLRRDAAAVEAGPAEEGVPLDHAGVEAELPRPDRRDVAAGSGPDDHKVVLGFGHRAPPSFSL